MSGDNFQWIRFSFPPLASEMIIIKGVTDMDIESALDELKASDPDEYALLMEHLPIERKTT